MTSEKGVFKNRNIGAVELSYALFCLSYYLMDLMNTNLIFQKSCRINTTWEPDLSTSCDDEARGIYFVSKFQSTYRYSFRTAITLFGILATTWSDHAGKRKIFVLSPIVGLLLQNVFLCYQSYFWSCSVELAFLTEGLFQVTTGGLLCFNAFVLINIYETTSVDNRTLRISMLSSLQILCVLVSSGLSGWLMFYVGFYRTYFICSIFAIISLVFAWISIYDIPRDEKCVATFRDAFNLRRILASMKVVFKKRQANERTTIIILLVANILNWFVLSGERSVFYLYARHRFKWDERIYGTFLLYKIIASIMGNLICSIILSKKLRIRDGWLGLLSELWCLTVCIFYMLANQTWQLFLAASADIFNAVPPSVCDSFVSKFFKKEELGRLYTVNMIFNLFTPICYPVYNWLFQTTMNYFPNAFFLLSIPIIGINAALFGIACLFQKPSRIPQEV